MVNSHWTTSGASVTFCDPNVTDPYLILDGISLSDALSQDAIHVLLVDHEEFKGNRPRKGTLIDFKGIWGGNT